MIGFIENNRLSSYPSGNYFCEKRKEKIGFCEDRYSCRNMRTLEVKDYSELSKAF